MTDRVFSPDTSLENFGVKFDVSLGDSQINLQHASQGGVTYKMQFAAGNQEIPQIPQGKAGIEVSFSSDNAIVLVVGEGCEHRIDNTHELSRSLLDLIARGDFPREYAVVTHVVAAGSATVLISSANDARFAASTQVDLKAGLLDLANGKAGFSRVASENLQTEIVAANGLTPLFKLVGFKKNGWFWGNPGIASLGFEDDDDPGDLSEVDPGDTDAGE